MNSNKYQGVANNMTYPFFFNVRFFLREKTILLIQNSYLGEIWAARVLWKICLEENSSHKLVVCEATTRVSHLATRLIVS